MLPDQTDQAILETKLAPGEPIGTKFIYRDFEAGAGSLFLNIIFMDKIKAGTSADIIFRYIRIEKGDDKFVEDYQFLKISYDKLELLK